MKLRTPLGIANCADWRPSQYWRCEREEVYAHYSVAHSDARFRTLGTRVPTAFKLAVFAGFRDPRSKSSIGSARRSLFDYGSIDLLRDSVVVVISA